MVQEMLRRVSSHNQCGNYSRCGGAGVPGEEWICNACGAIRAIAHAEEKMQNVSPAWRLKNPAWAG